MEQWKSTLPGADRPPEEDTLPGLDAWLADTVIPSLDANALLEEDGAANNDRAAEKDAAPDTDTAADRDAMPDYDDTAAGRDTVPGKNPAVDWKKRLRIWNRRAASFLLASCIAAAPLLGAMGAGTRAAGSGETTFDRTRPASLSDVVRAAVRLDTGAGKANPARLKNTGKIRMEGGRLLYGEREYYVEDGRVYLGGEAIRLDGELADALDGGFSMWGDAAGTGMDAGGETLSDAPPLRIAILDDTVYVISGEEEEWIAIDDSLANSAGNALSGTPAAEDARPNVPSSGNALPDTPAAEQAPVPVTGESLLQKALSENSGASSGTVRTVPSANEAEVYQFLKTTLGMNTAAACGVLANIYAESAFNPTVEILDTNHLMSFGLCQWNGGRYTALKNYCAEHGCDYRTVAGQLQYLQYELNHSESEAFRIVKNVDNTREGAFLAAYYWASRFERCATRYYESRAKRAWNVYWTRYSGASGDQETEKLVYLNLSGQLNGSNTDSLSGFGTVDVYVNGTLAAGGASDYDKAWPAGVRYEIRNIQAAEGYTYLGVGEGSLSGTVSNGTNVRLRFSGSKIGDSVTVTFDANGGTVDPAHKSVTAGKAVGELPVPVRNGYEFAGWYSEPEGGEKVSAETEVFANRTLCAHWTKTAVQCTVTFDANGGAVDPESKTVTTGGTYGELPEPVRAGYLFDGWYDGEWKITASSVVTVEFAHTLSAHWKRAACAVTFDANGGTVEPASRRVVFGETYGELPLPVRDGWKFDGWYTSPQAEGTPVSPSMTPPEKAEQTLYAHWTKQTGGNASLNGDLSDAGGASGAGGFIGSAGDSLPVSGTASPSESGTVSESGTTGMIPVSETEKPSVGAGTPSVSPVPDAPRAVPLITAEGGAAPAGDTVQAVLSLRNNPGVTSLHVKINFNGAVFSVVDVSGNRLLTLEDVENVDRNTCLLHWSGTGEEADGILAAVSFRVSEQAGPGVYPLVVSCDSAFGNWDQASVRFETNSGNIMIIETDSTADGAAGSERGAAVDSKPDSTVSPEPDSMETDSTVNPEPDSSADSTVNPEPDSSADSEPGGTVDSQTDNAADSETGGAEWDPPEVGSSDDFSENADSADNSSNNFSNDSSDSGFNSNDSNDSDAEEALLSSAEEETDQVDQAAQAEIIDWTEKIVPAEDADQADKTDPEADAEQTDKTDPAEDIDEMN